MRMFSLTMCSGLALSVMSGSAFAQAADNQAAADDGNVLQEIIVTATKRAEPLQDISISVNAVSAAELTNRVIVSPSDLRIPGVQFVTNSARSNLSIRGVSSDGNPGFDQAVPVYIDGI